MAQPSALGDPRLIAAAERAFGKLMAAMPGAMQEQAASIRARVHIDPTGWRPVGEDVLALPAIQEAVSHDPTSFLYTRPGGEAESRTVDPLGIVCKQAVWYLVARTAAGMRTYRISRMSGATPLAVGFERPARFNLAAWWKTTSAELGKRSQRFIATLALSPETTGSIGRWCPISPAPGTHVLPHRWKAFEVEFDDLNQARFTVQGLGAGAAVLAPRELLDAVDAEFARVTELRRSLAAG